MSSSLPPSPTSTSTPTHPPHQRVSKACEPCRKRKRKCDGLLPGCSPCVNHHLSCSYQHTYKKRGPQAGMVTRLKAQVNALETIINTQQHTGGAGGGVTLSDNSSSTNPMSASSPTSSSPVSSSSVSPNPCSLSLPLPSSYPVAVFSPSSVLSASLFHLPDGEEKVHRYRRTYFLLINSGLFPMLVQSHFDSCYSQYVSALHRAPTVWHLQLAAVLAHGAAIHEDQEFSNQAVEVARTAAALLFDQPSEEVIRGLLVLSFHCLSKNQLSRTSCYLAVASRMCAIISDEIPMDVPLFTRFLEVMLCSVRTWWDGLEAMEGKGQQTDKILTQKELYPQDWYRYERLKRYLNNRNQQQNALHRQATQGMARPAFLNKATSAQNTNSTSGGNDFSSNNIGDSATNTPASSCSSFSSVVPLSDVGPPDPADLDDSNIRWELVYCMIELAEKARSDNPGSMYHRLCILTKAEHSPLTAGVVQTLISMMKCQALFHVNDHAAAIEAARRTIQLSLHHDSTHNAFYSLVYHFLGQVFLRTGDAYHLQLCRAVMHKVASKWEFGVLPLKNIESRIEHAQLGDPAIPFINTMDYEFTQAFEPVSMLPRMDTPTAETLFAQSIISQDELNNLASQQSSYRYRHWKREDRQSMIHMTPSFHFPPLEAVIASIGDGFRQAYTVPKQVSNSESQDDSFTPLHASTQLSGHQMIRRGQETIPLKSEEIEVTPDAYTFTEQELMQRKRKEQHQQEHSSTDNFTQTVQMQLPHPVVPVGPLTDSVLSSTSSPLSLADPPQHTREINSSPTFTSTTVLAHPLGLPFFSAEHASLQCSLEETSSSSNGDGSLYHPSVLHSFSASVAAGQFVYKTLLGANTESFSAYRPVSDEFPSGQPQRKRGRQQKVQS